MNQPLEQAGDNKPLNLIDDKIMEGKKFLILWKNEARPSQSCSCKQAQYYAVPSEWAGNIN